MLNTTQIKQGAKRALLTEDSNALYQTGERAAGVYQGCSGHFERSSNFISPNKWYDTCFIYSSMLYALNITNFNWKMKFSLFLLIPLAYTLKTQYAPLTVNLNKMVVGQSSLRVHSSSLTSHHSPEETKPKGKP